MIGNIARVRGSACTIIFTEKCVKGKRCPYWVDCGYTVNECSAMSVTAIFQQLLME